MGRRASLVVVSSSSGEVVTVRGAREGPMLRAWSFLPSGPGLCGVEKAFGVVGFDPRGVGAGKQLCC